MVRLAFPELTEDGGEEIFVALRNPRTVPFDALRSKGVAYDANGKAVDQEQANRAMYEVYAGLIVNWRVYDASSEADDQPLLSCPATGELFARLPVEIQDRIADEVNRPRNPTKTPDGSNS